MFLGKTAKCCQIVGGTFVTVIVAKTASVMNCRLRSPGVSVVGSDYWWAGARIVVLRLMKRPNRAFLSAQPLNHLSLAYISCPIAQQLLVDRDLLIIEASRSRSDIPN